MALVQTGQQTRPASADEGMGAVAAAVPVSSSTSRQRRITTNIRVVARIRPMSKEEIASNCQASIHAILPAKEKQQKQPLCPQNPMGTSKPDSSTQRRSKLSTPQKRRSSTTQPKAATQRNSNSSNSENQNNNISIDHMTNSTSLVAGTENRCRLDFDAVFGPNETQKEVYDRSVGDTIRQELFQGYNATIIAIGQKSSGKSYTLSGGWKTDGKSKKNGQGKKSSSVVAESDGILPRAIHDLFKAKQQQVSSGGDASIRMSFIEISNQRIKDVLAECDTARPNSNVEYQDANSFEATKLAWITVDTPVQVKSLMDKASKQRAKKILVGSTTSSHLICRFHVSIVKSSSSQSVPSSERTVARLTLANLSGPYPPNTLEEGSQNDMQAFHKVVAALSERGKKKRSSIPYSDSILTKMLQNALGGNSRTVIIACVSPSDSKIESSMDTLRLAEKGRKVKNNIRKNIERNTEKQQSPTPEDIAAISNENKRLKAKLRELNRRVKIEESEKETPLISSEELCSLQIKLKIAEEAAKNARECSESVSEVADRWRSHRENYKASRNEDLSTPSSSEISPQIGDIPGLEKGTGAREWQDEEDLILGTNIDTIPSAVSGLTEFESEADSPPISIASSCGASEEDEHVSSSQEPNALPSSCSGASFERELRREINRRKSSSSRPALPVSQSSTRVSSSFNARGSLKKVSTSLAAPAPFGSHLKQSFQKRPSIGAGRPSAQLIVSDDITCLATRRRLICSAVEIILLKRNAEDGARSSAQLKRKLDEATLALRLYEGRTRGKDDQMILIEGLLKNQRETVEKLSKENSSLREQQSARGPTQSQMEQRVVCLRRELAATTKKLADECMAEKMSSKRKEDQIVLLKGLLKNQCDVVERLSKVQKNAGFRIQGSTVGSDFSAEAKDQEIESLQRELAETKKRLSDECTITIELEKLRKSLSIRGSLQDEKIHHLSKQLRSYSDQIAQKEAELSEMEFLLSGDRRMREQMQETQEVLTENHGSLAMEYTMLQIKCGEQAKEIRGLRKSGTDGIHLPEPTEEYVEAEHENEKDGRGQPSPTCLVDGMERRPAHLPSQIVEGITNIDDISGGLIENGRDHSSSIISGNLECVNFYLPKVGMADAAVTVNTQNHLALEMILREWQVEFLKSVGIVTPQDFVLIYNEVRNDLAKKLQSWRQANKLGPVKIQSCATALHIWSRSCEAAIRSCRS